jgi:hypothetical protein
VFFLEQKVVDDPFELDVKQRVSVGDGDGFHRQLDVFRSLMHHQVPVEQFIPDFGLRGVFPFSVDFNDAASSTANPRDILGNFGKDGTSP